MKLIYNSLCIDRSAGMLLFIKTLFAVGQTNAKLESVALN